MYTATTLNREISSLSFFQQHDSMITNLRADFERQAKEIETKYEKRMRALRDELDLRRKTEIHEIEVRNEANIQLQLHCLY